MIFRSFYGIRDAADVLCCSNKTLYGKIYKGEITRLEEGISVESVIEYLSANISLKSIKDETLKKLLEYHQFLTHCLKLREEGKGYELKLSFAGPSFNYKRKIIFSERTRKKTFIQFNTIISDFLKMGPYYYLWWKEIAKLIGRSESFTRNLLYGKTKFIKNKREESKLTCIVGHHGHGKGPIHYWKFNKRLNNFIEIGLQYYEEQEDKRFGRPQNIDQYRDSKGMIKFSDIKKELLEIPNVELHKFMRDISGIKLCDRSKIGYKIGKNDVYLNPEDVEKLKKTILGIFRQEKRLTNENISGIDRSFKKSKRFYNIEEPSDRELEEILRQETRI